MVCMFCLAGYSFFYEASTKLKREREFLENAKNIQKLLSDLDINRTRDNEKTNSDS